MMTKAEKEVARRRDEGLKRALNTPPQPRKGGKDNTPKSQKRTAGKGRARVGKSRG